MGRMTSGITGGMVKSFKSLNVICGAAFALMVAVLPARAVDPAPMAAIYLYNWTGPYIGGHAGWADLQSDFVMTEGNAFGANGTSVDADDDGFLGGGQIGYMHQSTDHLVFGVDISLSGADISATTPGPVAGVLESEIDLLVLAQFRMGWAMDNWLIFIQGGYAGADATVTGNGISSDSQWHNGWTIGAGVSVKLSQMFSIGAEYNYVELDDQDYNPVITAPTDLMDVDHEIHIFKITANLHFGGIFR